MPAPWLLPRLGGPEARALQLGGCPRAAAATHRESKRHERSIPCGNCRLTNSVGKGMGGTYLREVQGDWREQQHCLLFSV